MSQQPWGSSPPPRWPAPTGRPVVDPYGRYLGIPGRGPAPARRRPNRVLRVLITLVLAPFVFLVLLGVLGALTAQVPTPTLPGRQPSGAPSASPAPGSGTEWANADYRVPRADRNPPPLPQPATYAQATQWLEDNRLYRVDVGKPVQCTLEPVDLASASRAQLQVYLNDYTGCLMRVWGPALSQAGFTAVRPTVTVYSGTVQTACGRSKSANASYCGADQQIYYATDLPEVIPGRLQGRRFMVESVLAHEFGHAVQARSGILISEAALSQKAAEPKQLEFSRRIEVQADCLATQFINSIAQSQQFSASDEQTITQLFHAIGDDVLSGQSAIVGNHGLGASRQAWARIGLGTTHVGACNSFVTPASTVR